MATPSPRSPGLAHLCGPVGCSPVGALLKIPGDWQRFTGEPGAEGTLKTAAPKADKKEAFTAAAKESLASKEAKEGAKESKAASKASKPAKSSTAKDTAAK